MKKVYTLGLSALLAIVSCTKETTTTKPYVPPQPSLYGTWMTTTITGDKQYYVFANDGSDAAFMLTEDLLGFRSQQSAAYSATDKQVNMFNQLYNYKVNGDTLILMSSPSAITKFTRVANPTFTPSDWTRTITISRTIIPKFMQSWVEPFAINGDFLYFDAYNGSGYYYYKFNSLTGAYIDSINAPFGMTSVYKSANIYFGEYSSMAQPIKKITDFGGMASNVSTNDLYNVVSISHNGSSGTFYALDESRKMYSGTDGGSFSELYDFSSVGAQWVLYYNSDEFLMMRNSNLYRVKISPTFKVVASYAPLGTSNLSSVATNGVDVWVVHTDNNTGKLMLSKVVLN